MDAEIRPMSGGRPGIDAERNPTEAFNSSVDPSEPSRGARGSKRRGGSAATPPYASRSACGAGTCLRVLRSRTAAAQKFTAKDPSAVLSSRGAPAGSRCSHTPAMRNATKKSTAKKASQPSLGLKLSKPRAGKRRPPVSARARRPEADVDAPTCGEETGAGKGSRDNVADPDTAVTEEPSFRDDLICNPQTNTGKSWQCTTSQVKDVKKEENGIKEEESSAIILQNKKGEDNDTPQPSRKRGRRQKDDKGPRQPKRRKKPPVQYVRCEIEGCGTVLAHPRYLQHHIKYQHLLKKKYVCDHPSCGRLFRLQKQLLRHAKHHTDQRDYICEYCARAFKSSHNLAVHRMIHTGEKPIQCEICGFTCRQKASLNWHMKKHDAEATYQFSCSICGKKFEKKDSVIAHKAKSHPEVLIAEALAANGGSVISSTTPVPETVQVTTQPDQPSVSHENQEATGDKLTPLQQVVLPLAPQTPVDVSQGQFFQLSTHPVAHQLTATSPDQISSISQPQLNQLSTFPASAVTSMTTVDSQSTLFTLNSITTLSSTDTLALQQAVQWDREANEGAQIPGEGELWDRVIVGEGHKGVGEITWEGNGETRKEDEGISWERDGETQILLRRAELQGDSLM